MQNYWKVPKSIYIFIEMKSQLHFWSKLQVESGWNDFKLYSECIVN